MVNKNIKRARFNSEGTLAGPISQTSQFNSGARNKNRVEDIAIGALIIVLCGIAACTLILLAGIVAAVAG